MQLYGLKNCDTCRKAIKALPTAVLVDVRAEGVPADVLAAALATFGDALINTRSTTWRGFDEATRAEPPLDLLKAHPAVMKRPLIVDGSQMYLGFAKDVQAALSAT
ncbi:MAG: arsenate reductase family protein [Roseobacter sp.]